MKDTIQCFADLELLFRWGETPSFTSLCALCGSREGHNGFLRSRTPAVLWCFLAQFWCCTRGAVTPHKAPSSTPMGKDPIIRTVIREGQHLIKKYLFKLYLKEHMTNIQHAAFFTSQLKTWARRGFSANFQISSTCYGNRKNVHETSVRENSAWSQRSLLSSPIFLQLWLWHVLRLQKVHPPLW